MFRALLNTMRLRCPRCRQGKVYQRGMTMHQRCPVCDLLFEREQGYFLGALYVSYALASAFLATVAVTLHLLFPDLDLGLVVLIAGGIFLPFVPWTTRWSRVLWLHFDRWLWPSRPGSKE